MSQAIQAAIPGARLVVLAESSHLSVAEQPAEFAALVRSFLAHLPEHGALVPQVVAKIR